MEGGYALVFLKQLITQCTVCIISQIFLISAQFVSRCVMSTGSGIVVRGCPKSGKSWKIAQTSRFSSMNKDKPLKTSWQKKIAIKDEKLSVKKYQEKIIETRRQERLEHRRRVEAHKKTKEENQRKSEVVEIITNTAKLKRMKKKQLRRIEKRDINKLQRSRKQQNA